MSPSWRTSASVARAVLIVLFVLVAGEGLGRLYLAGIEAPHQPSEALDSPLEPAADLQIAVVGGGFAMGQGVASSAAFPRRLEARLRELGRSARVRVHAEPGARVGDLQPRVDAALRLSPDFLLIQWPGGEPDDAEPSSRSALWRIARYALRRALVANGIVESRAARMARRYADPEGEAARQASEALASAVESARTLGVPVGLLLVPDLAPGLLYDHPLRSVVDRTLAQCKASGIPCVDLRPRVALLSESAGATASPLSRQPGERVHALAVEAVLLHFAEPWGLLANAPAAPGEAVPRFGRFEIDVPRPGEVGNPFIDLALDAVFVSPSGRRLTLPGYFDGVGPAEVPLWRLRFMPDEVGTWHYLATFDDGSVSLRGRFECTDEEALPGPWRPDPVRPYWLRTARGDPFLPTAAFLNAPYSRADGVDALDWVEARGFDTLLTPTFNAKVWAEGWPNVTPFATAAGGGRRVDYERLNLEMWRIWDALLREASERGIYVAPFDGPAGDYGGQSGVGTKYPPDELAYQPALTGRFDTPHNLRVIRTLVARQAGFWSLAFWNLYSTEITEIKEPEEIVAYLEYFAAITPFGRMITAQDVEQGPLRMLSEARLPTGRRLATVQPAWIHDTGFQQAAPNNAFAIAIHRGMPVLATEALWEGQPRAEHAVPVIWGALVAGVHTVYADWRYDDGVDGGRWGSIGRGWVPLRPMSERALGLDQVGVDTSGDEQLPVATGILKRLRYWEMEPRNDLVAGGAEAYCLAEPGEQYAVYVPRGGEVALDLSAAVGLFEARWIDPRDGSAGPTTQTLGGAVRLLESPGSDDWILVVQR